MRLSAVFPKWTLHKGPFLFQSLVINLSYSFLEAILAHESSSGKNLLCHRHEASTTSPLEARLHRKIQLVSFYFSLFLLRLSLDSFYKQICRHYFWNKDNIHFWLVVQHLASFVQGLAHAKHFLYIPPAVFHSISAFPLCFNNSSILHMPFDVIVSMPRRIVSSLDMWLIQSTTIIKVANFFFLLTGGQLECINQIFIFLFFFWKIRLIIWLHFFNTCPNFWQW